MIVFDDVNKVVDDFGEFIIDKRINLVNLVVILWLVYDGWFESDGWVYGGFVESFISEDVSFNDEIYGDWCDCFEIIVFGVDGCGVDGVDKFEGYYDFEDEIV